MPTLLTQESHEAGLQASAAVLDKVKKLPRSTEREKREFKSEVHNLDWLRA